MNFNFELILFYAIIVSGIIVLLDNIFWAPKRAKSADKKLPIIVDYARSFFPILIIVFLLRSFLFEAYRIPSPSLEPTLLVGDFILVNKYDYGFRLPILHKKIVSMGEPQRGDIVVFRWPPDESINFIKRVVGVPGDHLSYIDKVLYVNGIKAVQSEEREPAEQIGDKDMLNAVQKQEDLLGVTHQIYQIPTRPSEDFRDIVVPPGNYFMMGDNRDDSADSRFWGYVPEKDLLGKAKWVVLSWNAQGSLLHKIRWERLGKAVH